MTWVDDVPSGWRGIATRLQADLQALDPDHKVLQVKSNKGLLWLDTTMPKANAADFFGRMAKAERESRFVCPTCGEPGTLQQAQGEKRTYTACPTHSEPGSKPVQNILGEH